MGAIRKAVLHRRPNFPGVEADSSVRRSEDRPQHTAVGIDDEAVKASNQRPGRFGFVLFAGNALPVFFRPDDDFSGYEVMQASYELAQTRQERIARRTACGRAARMIEPRDSTDGRSTVRLAVLHPLSGNGSPSGARRRAGGAA